MYITSGESCCRLCRCRIFSKPELIPGKCGHHESRYIVVSGYEERRVGLLVDELIGGQEIVIKSLGGYFEGLKGFAGVTEIGRHNVILVIDVETLTEEILLRHKGLVHV